MRKSIKNTSTKPRRPIPEREQSADTVRLDRDIPAEFRAPVENELPAQKPNLTNWSAAEDRGEDLIEERDPFIQQPERSTQIPPELIQQRAYELYEQRGRPDGEDLAHWMEAEQQLRGPIAKKAPPRG